MSQAHLVPPARRRPQSPRKTAIGMRWRLRAATAAAHERIHDHPGFAAAAAGAIEPADYCRLLARIFGFHRPFELVARQAAATAGVEIDIDGRARSPSLLADLKTLGLGPSAVARLPRWNPSHAYANEGSLLGALYVVEGSALGGVQIARALQGRIGDESGEGRRFFLGRGDRQSAMWRDLLERLEALSERPEQATHAIDAAAATFEDFEAWMAGWRFEAGAALWQASCR